MTKAQMRAALADVYAAEKWRSKVAKMNDSQVFAIYTKLKLQGKVK